MLVKDDGLADFKAQQDKEIVEVPPTA